MLKKTFAAVITTAALLGAGAAMAQPVDPNWAFSKELVEVLKNKNGYTVIKKIEAQDPAAGIWKAEGIKKLKRGADVPIAVLVPRVQLKKRLNVERMVAGRIPRLSAAIEKQLRQVD